MQAKLTSRFTLLLLSLLALQSNAQANDSQLATEAIINLPIADAWQLFTTEAGLKSLGYTQSKVMLQLQGAWQVSGGVAPLGDVNAEIISLDPEHMLSMRPVDKSPAQWTVLYFTAMGQEMTQLRWLEFFPDSQRAAITNHQQQVRKLFDQLIRRFAPECHVCKLEREREEALKK